MRRMFTLIWKHAFICNTFTAVLIKHLLKVLFYYKQIFSEMEKYAKNVC